MNLSAQLVLLDNGKNHNYIHNYFGQYLDHTLI